MNLHIPILSECFLIKYSLLKFTHRKKRLEVNIPKTFAFDYGE